MPIGSKGLTPKDLDAMTNEKLVAELNKAKEEMFNLRFQAATGQLEASNRVTALRRDVARIKTIMRERDLGMRVTPVEAGTTAAPTSRLPFRARLKRGRR